MIMAPSKKPEGDPVVMSQPVVLERSTYQLDMDRVASGGLDDDPTDSGDPVRNRRSFTNLTGGR